MISEFSVAVPQQEVDTMVARARVRATRLRRSTSTCRHMRSVEGKPLGRLPRHYGDDNAVHSHQITRANRGLRKIGTEIRVRDPRLFPKADNREYVDYGFSAGGTGPWY